MKRKVAKAKKRIAELDVLIKKLYETYAMGKLEEKRFEMLSAEYEKEQDELEQTLASDQASLDQFNEDTDRADKFLALAKKYTDFSELTAPMINEFVEKIVVHAPDCSTGERIQEIEIYLKFIGKFDVPMPEPTPEELAAEEKRRQKRIRDHEKYLRQKERKKKIAEGQIVPGEPYMLVCQCCGMPLEDAIISHNKDGSPNEDYCKWCYADGTYTYSSMDDLIDACVRHMTNEHFTEEQARAYMRDLLPTLDYWKRYDELSDNGQFEAFKRQLIQEINDLHVEGLPKVEKLNALVGRYVNLAYPLPSGAAANFLNDQTTYLGTQLESEFGGERCFGVLAGMDFILISTYGPEGEAPELVLYKKR